MCSLLIFVYAEFQLSAIFETPHVGPKSPNIDELYVGSVRVEVGFRIGASFITYVKFYFLFVLNCDKISILISTFIYHWSLHQLCRES